MRRFVFALAIFVHAAVAFVPMHMPSAPTCRGVRSNLEATRRDVISEISGLVAAAAVIQSPAYAEPVVVEPLKGTPRDNEIVKEQRTVTDKLDINNAPVADYMQLPGMYPSVGGKIANGGPYGSVKDVYKLKALSSDDKRVIKKYENMLTATPSTGLDTLRGRDPYRRSFNL
eukprot:CAMPEP_0201713978 /NCGR_PEP_ID=MMETSP0593-20130828/630_1 /ASSEMBLY_ACC=CAM_ASM_000672 /TAXON_ID=267983 /ORGANISM="Skeletonema japonicum, Strain CCMP2506" /LENGTH=171 /DNA_ID=CAMNT_0048203199 /DNA_START=65 /DNA_END=580 /DNA_ORIENTATION=-